MMNCRQPGFTLIELMVTIAIAAILLTIGVPSFQGLFNRNQVATVTNDFMSALNLARSEAAKGGATTQLCMSNNQSTCTGNSGWSNGWIVWADRNNNGALDNGELVRVHGPITAGKTIITGGVQTSFSFNGQGTLVGGWDTINVCTPNDLTLSNQVTIESNGHVGRKSKPDLGSCP